MMESVSLQEEEETRACSLSTMGGHSKKEAVSKPGGGTSPEPSHADILISDLQPPDGRIKCLLFKPLNRWYFVMAARADTEGNAWLSES